MSKLLNDTFLESLNRVLEYLAAGEDREDFLENDDPDGSIYKEVLIIRSFLGQDDITFHEAKQLLKTDCAKSVYYGSKNECDFGFTQDKEEMINLTEDEYNDDYQQFKFWI